MGNSNQLLNAIKNSQQEEASQEAATENVETNPVVEEVSWQPKEGEVLFEPSTEGALIRTALPTGREVGFPYIASDKEEVEFLTAFADHHGGLNVVKG